MSDFKYDKKLLELLKKLENTYSEDSEQNTEIKNDNEAIKASLKEGEAKKETAAAQSVSVSNNLNSGESISELIQNNLQIMSAIDKATVDELEQLRQELADFNYTMHERTLFTIEPQPDEVNKPYDFAVQQLNSALQDSGVSDKIVKSHYDEVFVKNDSPNVRFSQDEASYRERLKASQEIESRINAAAVSASGADSDLKFNKLPEKIQRYLESNDKKDHTGHRERLRKALLVAEGDWYKISEKNIVELLLSVTIPRVDVVPIVNNLFARFGSLRGIVHANLNDLVEVKGMTVNAAIVLSLIIKTYVIAEIGNKFDDSTYSNPNVFRDFFASYFANATYERVVCAYIDNSMRIMDIVIVSDGISDSVNISFRRIINDLSRLNAAGVVLAHNHVYGNAQPSATDIRCTRSLSTYLQAIGARLFDHVIVAPNDTFSFCSKNDCENYLRNSLAARTASSLRKAKEGNAVNENNTKENK